nr:MAG TPA: TRASH domain protein [Caudoviricetes sp.]
MGVRFNCDTRSYFCAKKCCRKWKKTGIFSPSLFLIFISEY